MRHPVTQITGIALAAILGLGAHSMASTSGNGSTPARVGSHAQDNDQDKRDSDSPDSGRPDRPSGHASRMVAIALAHRGGMKQWRACVKAGSKGCTKPEPPGWVKHPDQHPGGWPPKPADAEKD
ncbi:MAG TPA: hypothetical protein VGK78_10360 [Nocardioides sp.]|uniref:hypothetical protein n=1 Tax=Nocardioides sp. TaxID=35761 RepID=UPI002F3F8667